MLEHQLTRTIQTGRLTVHVGRRCIEVGAPPPDDPTLNIAIRLKRPSVAWALALNPDLCLGEAYTSGDLTIERGTLEGFLRLIGLNLCNRPPAPAVMRVGQAVRRRLESANHLAAARRNVAHHYDLSEVLYRQFLDEDLQYSCAYFARPEMTLDQAQKAKVQHLIAKLDLKPGQRVLDIGSGWGGLALAIARAARVQVTGITLSREQLAVARTRAKKSGLERRVSFELCDYREVSGHYDRIISVGMFEHVGRRHHGVFFERLAQLLADDGVALLHSIGCKGGRQSANNPWIRKYIFPGAYVPALSEATAAAEISGLWITDIEVLRLHYAETLRCWRERFLKGQASSGDLADPRFRRMWEFYLASCEMSFRYGDLMVFQMQLAKGVNTLPIVRDYMVDRERAMAGRTGETADRNLPAGRAAALP